MQFTLFLYSEIRSRLDRIKEAFLFFLFYSGPYMPGPGTESATFWLLNDAPTS